MYRGSRKLERLAVSKRVNLQTLSGHTVDLDLLPEFCTVLDVGCRGFDFTECILSHRPLARIVALDPDPTIKLSSSQVEFFCVALVGDERPLARYASYSTGKGNMLTDLEAYYDAEMLTVNCISIRRLMKHCRVEHWDLVKLDCEGSEFEVLENWPGPIASQISVEFHDGADPTNRTDEYFGKLFAKLPDYRIVQHEKLKQGEWIGHWDSLLVAA